MPIKKEWFEEWFNSPYYHILYKSHDFQEAEKFIDNLVDFLKPKIASRFLDLGCGKGRHSTYLNKKGYTVAGVDLSPESIRYALQFEKASSDKNKSLEFFIQDMRKTGRIGYYDYVLNLFTSFGYFDSERDDYATINSVSKALKPGGIFVLDFLNAQKVVDTLNSAETKICEGITFKITREFIDGFIVKNIRFTDKGKDYRFQEKVKAITAEDFKKYFEANQLNVLHLRGNYQLEEFDIDNSDRLIIIGQKKP